MRPLARWWLWVWSLLSSAGQGATDDPSAVQVHVMLKAAMAKAGAPQEEKEAVTEACVSPEAASAWKAAFTAAVQTMLQKTRRTMQTGLSEVASSVVALVDSHSCGKIPTLERFREQATRLRVLATSHGGLASLDSKVKYEPLKALSVGAIDIHSSINLLIVGWQLQKGSDVVGEALGGLLAQFSEEPEESLDAAVPTPVPEGPLGREHKHSPAFWAKALQEAFSRLGDPAPEVGEECLGQGVVEAFGAQLDEAFRSMMQKTKKGMHTGMRNLASELLKLLDAAEAVCSALKSSLGSRRLRSAATRLSVLASAKTLMQHGAHVEYEAMKVLKIGGIDIHLELNRFIGDWLNERPPVDLGISLANFLSDFKEEVEPEEASSTQVFSPLQTMLRGAFLAAQVGRDERIDLPTSCFSDPNSFLADVEAAVDHMLQKRRRTMHQGLRELADATDRLLAGQEVKCVWSSGAKLIWKAAKKLRRLTRRTVVDYGANIQYEAMKSLTVGNVAIHSELNHFIAAWKLRSREESGTPFGDLMLRLSELEGSDEL